MPQGYEIRRIRLWGIVQGVGMRPLAARLARDLALGGHVSNAGGMLDIIIAGPALQLDLYWMRLQAEKPEPAVYIRHHVETLDPGALPAVPETFVIGQSREDEGLAFPAPDLAICAHCDAEMADPADRRYHHPFISCMHCGPRYSILERLPYDRETTTMAHFPLCPACEGEYRSADDRRFHAQTIACPDCGPMLHWLERAGSQDLVETPLAGESAALERAISCIQAGGVIAVKATGGFHLVCDAKNQAAVQNCRAIKRREQKPFAVLFANPEQILAYAEVSPSEADLLCSQARPVVLLRQHGQQLDRGQLADPGQPTLLVQLAAAVSLQSPWLGAMLPSTPIQKLIAEACGPLVMTSANRSDDQLIFRDQDMLGFGREQPQLAGILTHDRAILTGLDDSVVRWISGRMQLIRRARGYVPLAINLGRGGEKSPAILAMGADMKSTSAVVTAGFAWPTQPAGDLVRLDVQEAWQCQQDHLQKLLRIVPELVCHDLHPAYFSSEFAQGLAARNPRTGLLSVQHHHAHIASVIAEHQLVQPVIGVAMDGTGFGTDQTIWGGEFLLCYGKTFDRMAHFKPVLLPGGDTGMRDAWRSLAGYLEAAGLQNPHWLGLDLVPGQQQSSSDKYTLVRTALRAGINCVPNSSVGRLFDAVCALLDLSAVNHFEGECGSLLEYQAISASERGLAPWPLKFAIDKSSTDNSLIIDPAPVVSAIFATMAAHSSGQNPEHTLDLVSRLALGFHHALSEVALEICLRLAKKTGISTIALSGGVFQNSVLTNQLDVALKQAGFRVYWNEKVPPHDGGICLGQAWLGQLERN